MTTPTPPATDTAPWTTAAPGTRPAEPAQAEPRAYEQQNEPKVPRQPGPSALPAHSGPTQQPAPPGQTRAGHGEPVPDEQAAPGQLPGKDRPFERTVRPRQNERGEQAAPTAQFDAPPQQPDEADGTAARTPARPARARPAPGRGVPARSGPPRGGPPGRRDSRRPSASALRAAAARERERQPPFWFASRLLLVLSGQRPVHTLLRHTRSSAYDQLSRLAAQAPLRPQGADRRTPAVLEARGSRPADGVIEAYARVVTGGRQRAMAFRLEHCPDRQWRCTAIELDGLAPVRRG